MHFFDYSEYVTDVTVSELVPFAVKNRTVALSYEVAQTTYGVLDQVFVRLNAHVFKNVRVLMAMRIAFLPQLLNIAFWKSQDSVGNDPEKQKILHRKVAFFLVEQQVEHVETFLNVVLIAIAKHPKHHFE